MLKNLLLKNFVLVLIQNGDIESYEEFEASVKLDYDFFINNWIRWRADGGLMKNEVPVPGLAEACRQILALV